MAGQAQGMARPASVDDLKLLLGALNAYGVDYLLIGGYALYALGYQRATVAVWRSSCLKRCGYSTVHILLQTWTKARWPASANGWNNTELSHERNDN